jgi:glucose/arabinose dehydrogenase
VRPTLRGTVLAGVPTLALLTVTAGLCRFELDCHLRSVPLLSRLAHEPPVLEGVRERGTGETRLPPGFRQEVVASDLTLPTSFAELPDGQFLVAEKAGLVRVVRAGRVLSQPFVDLRPVVDSSGIRGLVAVEVAPDFPRTGFVYLLYARELGPGRRTLLLTRMRADGDVASLGSEEVILGAADPQTCAASRRPATASSWTATTRAVSSSSSTTERCSYRSGTAAASSMAPCRMPSARKISTRCRGSSCA